ncbi:fibronectin type III-like domain-contianing protein, partial [Mesobacillus subterraneus]|uniref:fibronectin type III-like domain-contianing protein n=1 Tax=Mesobacillus subterraneus TaxID=285983 RepID=UPI00203B526B
EVAQIYASLPAGLNEPPQRLVGWNKVMLQPGQSRQISVTIPARRFATWNADAHAWQVNPGRYTLTAAGSSHDPNAQQQALDLTATQPLERRLTVCPRVSPCSLSGTRLRYRPDGARAVERVSPSRSRG